MATIHVELDNVNFHIKDTLLSDVNNAITSICSYRYETYSPGTGKTFFNCSIYDKKSQTVPSGLANRVTNKLKELGYRIKLSDKRTVPIVDIEKMISRAKNFDSALRNYQIEGVLSGIENGNGLFDWCTGSGKTLTFSFLLMSYDKPSLILVNRKELMYQTARELSRMTGKEVGVIGDGVWNPKKWTVGIVNTLNKGINSKKDYDIVRTMRFLDSVELFIGDEIHHLGAKTWKGIAKACRNASARFGFSGTCFHPDSEDLFLVAYTGEIISSVSASRLIKEGYLARPHIYMPTKDSGMIEHRNYKSWHDMRKASIRDNELVNKSGINFVLKMYDKGLTCIYFSGADIEHGQKIRERLILEGVEPKDIRFMTGRESSEVRQKALKDFINKKFKILGGTTLYDEGIDVPHVNSGANFGQGNSEISTTQRIGRVLRKEKGAKDVDVNTSVEQIKYYWDPLNISNSVVARHSRFRKQIYEKQPEFKIFNVEYSG